MGPASDYGITHAAAGDHAEGQGRGVLRAIELDPTLAERTHRSFPSRACTWHWKEAEWYYRRAIELNPGYVTGRHWYGCDYLLVLGA
jgi:hypothetical protein